MGQCGCGDLQVHRIFKIDEDRYVVLNKYPGCTYCEAVIGLTVYFFNKQAFKEWLEGYEEDVEDVQFDEYGGSYQSLLFFDVDKDLVPSLKVHHNINEYESTENYFKDVGLDIIQEAMMSANKRESN